MKRSLTLTTLLMFAFCSLASDTTVQKILPGIWHVQVTTNVASVFNIAPDLGFTCQSTSGGPPVELSGTLVVTNGFLIETVTNSTQAAVKGRFPFTMRFRIIKSEPDRVVLGTGGTNHVVMLKKTN